MRPTYHYIPCSDTRGGRLVFYPRGIWRWDDATTPRTDRPVRFVRCGSIWHRYTDGRPLSIMPATRIA